MAGYREFKGDLWLNQLIQLPGGALFLMEDKQTRSAMHMAITRAGKKAKVYRARRGGVDVAVKVFFRKFALDVNLWTTGQLGRFKNVPGLRVCDREVISNEVALQIGEPGLAFAILMPWIAGESWIDIIGQERVLSQQDCISLAQRTAAILAGLETWQLAHADISSTNVFIANLGPRPAVELIDVEDMYHPSFIDVPHVPDGTDGYGHPGNTGKGCRNPFGDRFAGSVLLAEMLTWHQRAIREMAEEESLFAKAELCRQGEKYLAVRDALEAHSPSVAALFERAWTSRGLRGCPSLADWKSAMATVGRTTVTVSARLPSPQLPRSIGQYVQFRSQTTFIDGSFCTECSRIVHASRPTDHAPNCSHHPAQFTPEFDWSTWLVQPSQKPKLPSEFSNLLKRYSALIETCPGCGKLVTGATDDAHVAGCPNSQRPSSRSAAAGPSLPKFDDVSFVRFDRSAARPSRPASPFVRPQPTGLPAGGPQRCGLCGRFITVSGTTEWGHKLTCWNSTVRKFLREL